MLEIYTIYGGGMWKSAFDAVVGILGTSTWGTLLRIVGTFSVLGIVASFVKSRNPMVFVQWLAVFTLITSVLIVPKRSVQIIDITDPATVWVTDNVPVGLAGIASLSTSIGFHMAQLYDYMMARPDSVTYTKTGMLFGSGIVAESSDMQTQNPELAQMLPDYVENCVIGDILLNHKYTVNQLLNTTDPLGLITSNPSPLRGIFKTTSDTREFLTCQQAAAQIQTLAGQDAQVSSPTFAWLTQKIFGNRLNGATLLANSMGESYGFFYAGGMSAAQIMKNNVTNSAIQQGIRGFAARSSDTANLLNLATENAATKQRISWAAGSTLATRQLPFLQSLMMLILVCLFPLVIALAAANHSIFGLNTLKIYICGFLYFQMWPVMFAILNYAATFWLQTKTGGTPLVLSNKDAVALQHSDVANLAGYCAMSIPVLSFFLTKGAAAIGSQVAGSVMSSMAFGSAGVASTTADGNWSFNNMSMDNVNQNKMDTNLMQRQGQQTWQADNGSSHTVTASGQNVIDGSGAMSNLPVNMRLSQLASSGFQEQARLSQVQAQSSLDGYNHSVTSGWSQLQQVASQSGSTDSLNQGSDNSQTLNASRGATMMMSAAESYAKANNISTQQAYNELMDISNQGSAAAGVKGSASGGINLGVVKVGGEAYGNAELRHSTGSSRGIQDTGAASNDHRHDQSSQMVRDFKQGMDMVTSSRISDSANHSDSAGTSNVQQFAATLNDAQSQYHQFTASSTNSDEFSRMATLAQNQSASLDTNYTQEFVDWASNKYGDKAQAMLTSAPTAREAAMEFVNERLKPEIMGDYQQGRADLTSGNEHAAFSGNHIVQSSDMTSEAVSQTTSASSGNSANGRHTVNNETAVPASHSLEDTAGNHLRGNRVPGEDMQNDFRENQNRLKGQSFGEQSDVPRKVAEERSANEQNINKSAGEIDKKQSTVQTSSDILKGETHNAEGKFNLERKEREYDQSSNWNPFNKLDPDQLKDEVERLRKNGSKR
ncbi:conjugal transfer mating-pair stabilization protein TraG [Kosakonia radicincitans]|uniref:conjugal transfer mating-pair stabilization protein TraG n=1 Tax=Kosakonia radicincitans TaxID=283686 RepID=UPI002368367A|nr:conjugal transfer mating-pair stabilization protein TraG [Kosakonia radicincitans]MDD7997505.1 conjugal transfer mating pair stabilization protein TraG [Kosakonia radicincitans]